MHHEVGGVGFDYVGGGRGADDVGLIACQKLGGGSRGVEVYQISTWVLSAMRDLTKGKWVIVPSLADAMAEK